MQLYSTLATLATVVAVDASLPRDIAHTRLSSTYVWNVTNWQAGLSHGNPAEPVTGFYVFNISAPATTVQGCPIPPFAAYCHGFAESIPLASAFANCTLNAETAGVVEARVYPTNDSTQCHVAVSYAASGDGGNWNLTGYTAKDWARERPPVNFTIADIEIE